ncbi:MAG: hypothetical protein WCK65_06725 [Rhodospirillaceae bacterium]
MARLEDIRNGACVAGIVSAQVVQALSVERIGDQAVNVVFRNPAGTVAEATLYRDDEPRLEIQANGRLWSFDGGGAPTSRVLRRFQQSISVVRKDGTALGNVTGGELTYANKLSAVRTIRESISIGGKIDGCDLGVAAWQPARSASASPTPCCSTPPAQARRSPSHSAGSSTPTTR